jgi:hypothetical protein
MTIERIAELISNPIWVGLIVGISLYVVRSRAERQALTCALIMEINQIREYSNEIRDFLSSNEHYWLKVGGTISEAPTNTGPTTRLVTVALPKIHLLAKKDVRKVLRFYLHYQLCENLVSSLYEHIRHHVQSGDALTTIHVRILQVRRDRVCGGYESLFSGTELTISKLCQLADNYAIESTTATAERINQLLQGQ